MAGRKMWVLGMVLTMQLALGHRILAEDDMALAPAPMSMEETEWDYLDQDETLMDELDLVTTIQVEETPEPAADLEEAPEPAEDLLEVTSDELEEVIGMYEDAPAPAPEEDPFETTSESFLDLEEDLLDDAPAPEPEEDPFEEDIPEDTLPVEIEAPSPTPEPEDFDLLEDADDLFDTDEPVSEAPTMEPTPSPQVDAPADDGEIEIVPAPLEDPVDDGEAEACTDIPPDDEFTCEEQKKFGKCLRPWMLAGDYCARTCGRCE